MYTRRLVYQHGISRQLLKRMSDEKYKVADAWNLDDANVKEFKEKNQKFPRISGRIYAGIFYLKNIVILR
mgnify:CR=1 FL=1